MQDVSSHLEGQVKPLCQATALLLRPETHLQPHDVLQISVKPNARVDSPAQFVLCASPQSSNYARMRWWSRIPGAEYYAPALTQKVGCLAPITDTTTLCVMAVWGKDRLIFEDELAKLEFWTRYTGFIKSTRVAEWQAKFKEDHSIPAAAPVGNATLPLMAHQRVATQCAGYSEGYALFMEQRTGKTPVCIAAMDEDSMAVPHQMNLVICPKNVRANWEHEIKAFTTKKVHIIVIRGGAIERLKSLLTAFEYRKDYDYTVVICSYESCTRSISKFATFQWRWGILDESHFIKSQATNRWKAMKKLRDSCQRRIAATGTPICNHAFDLYTQLEWLGEGVSGFATQEAFRRFYGTWVPSGHGYEKLVGMRNMPLLQERLARYCFLARRVEVLPDMPKVTHSIREYEMTEYQAMIYRQVAEELYAEIEREIEINPANKSVITVNNALTKLLRLAQITAGFVVLDGEIDIETGEVINQEIDRLDPNPKLEELVAYIKERPDNSKVIVWSWFVLGIKMIRARLELEGIKCVTYYGATTDRARDEAVELFNNDPTVKVFVGQPAAGGVGLDLSGRCLDENGKQTTQADSMVYYSQGWSASVRAQSGARPLHKDIEWPVETLDLCAMNTIDTTILDRVVNKQLHAMEIQDIRDILKGLLGK